MIIKSKDIFEIIVTKWWMFVGLAIVSSFSLSLLMGLGQSVWFDEGYSILLAKQTTTDLLALTNVDAHPPLYYLLLKAWGEVFGWSELALRALSALLMAAAVGVSMVLVRILFSHKAALFSAPLLVIAPFLLRYGYEIRMYALATLIGVLATCVFVYALKTKANKKVWIFYGVFVALGMYTLYMTLVVWLAHAVWLLLKTSPKKEIFKHPAIIGYLVSLLVFLPQLPTFIFQTLHSALPGVGSELTLTKLVSVFSVLTVYTPEWKIGGWVSLALLFAAIVFGVILSRLLNNKSYRQGLLFLITLVVVPVIFYALSSLPPRTPIFIERYMAHVSIYFYLLIAVVAVLAFTLKSKAMPVIFASTAGLLLLIGAVRLYDTGNFNLERMQMPETKEIRASIMCDENTTVVADDPYTYIDSFYYFDGCNQVFYSKDEIAFKGGYAPLSNDEQRISSPQDVKSNRLIHLTWEGQSPSFEPDSSYRLESKEVYNKQVVSIYTK